MKNIKNFIYTSCAIAIMLMSCNGNKSKSIDSDDNIADILSIESDEQKVKSEILEIIHPALFEELDEFTLNMKVYPKESTINVNIVFVFFEQKAGDCCVFIVPNYYYRNENLSGYFLLNGKMIAFYRLEDDDGCNCNLVDATKLKTDKTDKYPDEHSRPDIDYDPSGKIFKINKEDKSLELIYSGNM